MRILIDSKSNCVSVVRTHLVAGVRALSKLFSFGATRLSDSARYVNIYKKIIEIVT